MAPKAKGGGDKYVFDVEVEPHDQELVLLSRKLKSPPKSKDQLIKLLKVGAGGAQVGGMAERRGGG